MNKISKYTMIYAALRDTLLPKLISGEIRVKDAEKFLRNAKHFNTTGGLGND